MLAYAVIMCQTPVPDDLIRELADEARAVVCTICGQHADSPCQPPGIMHLARFSRARDQGKIRAGDFEQVIAYLQQHGKLAQYFTLEVPLS